ncbi:MAG: hypothetical protein ACFB21_16230 [Opitutales bacterium]
MKNELKKLSWTALIGSLVLVGFVGCDDDDDDNSNAAPATIAGTTLDLNPTLVLDPGGTFTYDNDDDGDDFPLGTETGTFTYSIADSENEADLVLVDDDNTTDPDVNITIRLFDFEDGDDDGTYDSFGYVAEADDGSLTVEGNGTFVGDGPEAPVEEEEDDDNDNGNGSGTAASGVSGRTITLSPDNGDDLQVTFIEEPVATYAEALDSFNITDNPEFLPEDDYDDQFEEIDGLDEQGTNNLGDIYGYSASGSTADLTFASTDNGVLVITDVDMVFTDASSGTFSGTVEGQPASGTFVIN